MSTTGLVGLELMTSTVNGETFFDFARGTLRPKMMPFNGSNPKSIVIMDNLRVHHMSEVKYLFKQAGILVLYLTPYRPGLCLAMSKTF